jgi:chromosome segregation ATPase
VLQLRTSENEAAMERTTAKEMRNKLEERVHALEADCDTLKATCDELDVQCEQLSALKRRHERAATEWKTKLAALQDELANKAASTTVDADELERARRDRDRLERKVAALLEEIQETHADYKTELDMLTDQVKQANTIENTTAASTVREKAARIDMAQFEFVVNERRQAQTELAAAERRLKEALADCAKSAEEVSPF